MKKINFKTLACVTAISITFALSLSGCSNAKNKEKDRMINPITSSQPNGKDNMPELPTMPKMPDLPELPNSSNNIPTPLPAPMPGRNIPNERNKQKPVQRRTMSVNEVEYYDN